MAPRAAFAEPEDASVVEAPEGAAEESAARDDRAKSAVDRANEMQDPMPYWARGRTRWFLSTAFDIGFSYLRPRASVGYGKPHNKWVGIDVNPIVGPSAVGGYSGIRLAAPLIDLRVGGRYFRGFRRSYLPIQERYDRLDIQARGDDPAQYVALESELTLVGPVGPGAVLAELAVTNLHGVPDDVYVFLENIRVVAAPPWVYRGRLGYGLSFGPTGAFRVAPIVEVVWIQKREDAVVRAGFTMRWKLFDDLEARANFVPVVNSPDSLGINGGDFGQFGLRWRWATGQSD